MPPLKQKCETRTKILGFLWNLQAGIVGWSKTMIEKQRVPGSSPAWKSDLLTSQRLGTASAP